VKGLQAICLKSFFIFILFFLILFHFIFILFHFIFILFFLFHFIFDFRRIPFGNRAGHPRKNCFGLYLKNFFEKLFLQFFRFFVVSLLEIGRGIRGKTVSGCI